VVKGIEIFRDRFRPFERSFILIGGAACDEWFTRQGLAFRATKDLDIVLLIEVLDREFVAAMRAFVEKGGYEIRQRAKGSPVLYRFAKPHDDRFPAMIELFSRNPENFDLADGQFIIPVQVEPDQHSLSAILLDEAYYHVIQSHSEERDGLRFGTVAALIPLKACAWLDLSARKERGENIDSSDIDKHRNDVFRLAATLPGEPGPELPPSVINDLNRFLTAFPDESPEWPRILDALKAVFGGGLLPSDLRSAIRTFFRLAA
jgi:hypothetical protein